MNVKNLIFFGLGAATGALITWKLIEKKYKDLADEEIQSVVDTFRNRKIENDIQEVEVKEEIIKSDNIKKIKHDKLITDLGYKEKDEITIENIESPISVINEQEYGDLPGYDAKEWMCWDDGVITDEYDMPVKGYQKYIGEISLEELRVNEFGTIYIRNSDQKCDYEIMYSEKKFNEE